MLQIDDYVYAESLEEAYGILQTQSGATILGGCGYLRLGGRKIATAIDLNRLDLDYVRETGQDIEIGAMTSLRTLETAALIQQLSSGLLSKSVANIVGIQLRNGVTIGGTVAGRYPFSDPITALMALEAELVFHNHGRISLNDFLAGKGLKDILVKVVIPKRDSRGAYQSVRRSHTDYAILNTAVTLKNDNHKIIVGCRPGRSAAAVKAENYLNEHGLTSESALEAGRLAADELKFGDNPRGSGDYRKAICPVLVQRALMEVMNAA